MRAIANGTHTFINALPNYVICSSHVFYFTDKLCVKVYIPVLQTAFVHQGVPVASHVQVLQPSPWGILVAPGA